MKLTFTLLSLLLTCTTITSSQAGVDFVDQKGSTSDPHASVRPSILVADVDGTNQDGGRYLQTLDGFLARDDFVGAKDFVDTLQDKADVTAATLRSLNAKIRRVKAARIIDYAEKVREGIASSDFDTVKEYNERMRRLTQGALEPPATGEVEAAKSVAPERQAPGDLTSPSQQDGAAEEVRLQRSVGDNADLVRRMRTARDDGHLFPPTPDNAFDLAALRLSAMPDDTEARRIMNEVIDEQQTQVLGDLEEGRPERALERSRRLLAVVEPLGSEGATSRHRSSTLRWFEQVKPDIIKGLVDGAEQAIAKRQLTYAPEGETSAEGYAGLLATELGRDHETVTLLADNIIERYRELIAQRVARKQYDRALILQARMEVIAQRFSVKTDQVAALRREIEELPAREDEHARLLEAAGRYRDRGQLIEPPGANALEAAATAVKLAVDPAAADKIFNDVITEQRRRIDRLLEAGGLQEAADQLRRLGSAIERNDAKQGAQAKALYAEAEQISKRADLATSQRRQQADDADQGNPVAAAATETSPTEQSPFTFINPF